MFPGWLQGFFRMIISNERSKGTRWSPTIRWSQLFDDPQLFDDQLEVLTLIIQKSTVIPSSPMVLFFYYVVDCAFCPCWLCCWPCCWLCRGLAGGQFVSSDVVPLLPMLLTVLRTMRTMMTMMTKYMKKWYFACRANQHLIRSIRVLPSHNMLQVTLVWKKNVLIDHLKRNYLKKASPYSNFI